MQILTATTISEQTYGIVGNTGNYEVGSGFSI